jgi:hypothetical protein
MLHKQNRDIIFKIFLGHSSLIHGYEEFNFCRTIPFICIGIFPTGNNGNKAQELFRNIKTKLTGAEKNRIFKETDLSYSNGGFNYDGMNISVVTYNPDLNKDGKEEVFIVMSGSYFGQAGVDFMLYIRDQKGILKRQDIGGGIPVIIPTPKAAYPSIAVAGPGFTFPVYKWTTTGYKMSGQISDEKLSKVGKHLEELK